MSASTVAFMGAMVYANPALLDALAIHLEDQHGEILPHVLMGDVVRWVEASLMSHRDEVLTLLEWLENAYVAGDRDVRNVISVSFLEMLPEPGEPSAGVRTMLGPVLAEVAGEME